MRHGNATDQVCAPLETVRVPEELEGVNPAMQMEWQRAIILSVASSNGPLLIILRRYKRGVASIMRCIKRWCSTLWERASAIMRAVCAYCSTGAVAHPKENAKCMRYLMVTAQHDDAMQDCPARGLAGL